MYERLITDATDQVVLAEQTEWAGSRHPAFVRHERGPSVVVPDTHCP